MSRKGKCYDNAAIESFFVTLKAEYFHIAAPSSLDALEAGAHACIRYYNHERIQLGLPGLSPVGYLLRNTAWLVGSEPSNFWGQFIPGAVQSDRWYPRSSSA